MAETHSLVAGSERKPRPGTTLVGPTNPGDVIQITLKIRRKAEIPEITSRPAEQMTREEVSAAYGANQADVDTAINALTPYGLTLVSTDLATRTVTLSGSVANVQKAFQVTLNDYVDSHSSYRGREGHLYVPESLKDIVVGVFGLDNRSVVKKRRQPIRDEHARKPKPPANESAWYKPAQLATHYNYPSGDGSGQTVGILEFGGGYFPADLHQFCTLAGTAVPVVEAVSTDSTATDAKDGAEGEVMLDIEVIAGLCPKAKIVVYFAAFTEQGWITAIDAVMNDTANSPKVVSVSWGYAEDAYIWSAAAMTQVSETLKEAALMGVTVCVAAGDDGSSDAITTDGKAHVDFPSSSPYALAVGGTTIPSLNTADIGWKEGSGMRSDGGGSTGGGVSTMFPQPTWQQGINIPSINPGSIAGRIVPDIAANADWDKSPYLLVVDGAAQPNGGTSAATPLIAGLITLINAQRPAGKSVGYLSPVLYPSTSSGTITAGAGSVGCTDVTVGDNSTSAVGGYSASVGFDAISGWGVPDGQKLMAALANI